MIQQPLNVINTEFRSYSIVNKYPFTADSSMCDVNGRAIPMSFVIDAVVYPNNKTSYVYISRIFMQQENVMGIELSSQEKVLGYVYNATQGTNYFIAGEYQNKIDNELGEQDAIIGTIVLSGTISYIKGLCETHELIFNNNALVIDPTRVLLDLYTAQELFVNGKRVFLTKPLIIWFSSPRFVFNNNQLSLDVTVNEETTQSPIISINGFKPSTKKLWLFSKYENSDIRVITEENKITLLKIGDD